MKRPTDSVPPKGFSRRRLLTTGTAAGAGGLLIGATSASALAPGHDRPAPSTTPALATAIVTGNQKLPFYGPRQPGIIAPTQSQYRLLAFDPLPGTTRRQVGEMLATWAKIAAAAMAADPITVPIEDDAMAQGRGPANLTVTTGLGASLLTRIGLADQIPEALAPLPPFPGDQLDPATSDGDLSILIGGNDGLVIAHAQRAIMRATAGIAVHRWQIAGFSDPPGALPNPTATPRNLMGQLDGTDNPTPNQPGFADQIFVGSTGQPEWMRDGSYLVVRRIRMLLNDWDQLPRARQEAVIGRRKDNGAPLSGGSEHTPPDYTAQTATGGLAIPPDAHIRLANPAANQGATILRRGFSYDRGVRADGSPDAGLVFLAYQADPRTGFVPIQQHLSGGDALNDLIVHESSAVFAIPGGCELGGYPGEGVIGVIGAVG